MALKRLPRRLEHGEEATLVEHLGELRARLLISILTLAPAFLVAFYFQEHHPWLLAASRRQGSRHPGVVELFTTASSEHGRQSQ